MRNLEIVQRRYLRFSIKSCQGLFVRCRIMRSPCEVVWIALGIYSSMTFPPKLRTLRSKRGIDYGAVPKWSNGADCKSVGTVLRRFDSSLLHQLSKTGIIRYYQVL